MAVIDPTKPVFGSPTTASVRANFAALTDSIGFADYQDTLTTGAPISVPVTTWTDLTNNTLGTNTKTFALPTDVTGLWNPLTSAFNFSTIPLYSMITIRADYKITTSAVNQILRQRMEFAIGDPVAFFLERTQTQFKTAAQYQVVADYAFYIGSTPVQTNPAKLQVYSDATATVIVNGWYVKIEKMLRTVTP